MVIHFGSLGTKIINKKRKYLVIKIQSFQSIGVVVYEIVKIGWKYTLFRTQIMM